MIELNLQPPLPSPNLGSKVPTLYSHGLSFWWPAPILKPSRNLPLGHLISNKDSPITQKIPRVFEVLCQELGTKTRYVLHYTMEGLSLSFNQELAEAERVTCSKSSSWSVATMQPELRSGPNLWAYSFFFFFFKYLFIWLGRVLVAACGIFSCGIHLVPWPGIQPVPLAMEARSLNHWIACEVPGCLFFRHPSYSWKGPVVTHKRLESLLRCQPYCIDSNFHLQIKDSHFSSVY